jgi:hypothetical protein
MSKGGEHARRAGFRSGLLLPIVLLSFPATPPCVASDPGVLSGTVRDSVGNLLEDVEVLLAGRKTVVKPLATVSSDADGRFAIRHLAPGSYRIAALKAGYLTYVGVVNTRLESWIDVILQPIPEGMEAAGKPIPPQGTWVLRLPERSVLRETRADPAPREATPQPAKRRNDSLQLQVDQMFAVRSHFQGGDADAPAAEGSETRLSVASQLGDRGNIRVQGRHESLDSSRRSGQAGSSASQDASALNMAFSYDPTLDTRLMVRAFYTERDLQWSADLTDPASAQRHGNRSWGYDARWSKQFDEISRLAVSMNYRDSTAELSALAGATPWRTLDSTVSALERLNSRTMGGTGSYERLAARRHRLEITFRARLLESPLETWRSPTSVGARGFSFELDGQDSWRVSQGVSLVYGLGYRHALTSRDTSLIISRAGAVWTDEKLVLRLLFSHHAVANWQTDALDPQLRPYRPASGIGYEAQLELPLDYGLRIVASTSHSPILADFFGYDGGELRPGAAPIYLTDGNVKVGKQRLAVVHDSNRTRTYFELTLGDARGTLAAVMPYDVLFQDLDQSDLDYTSGRLGVRVVPSGTDVLFEYRQVDESPTEGASAAGSQQTALELRLMQDLMRLRSLGYWRLLMAARMARIDVEEEAERLPGSDTMLLGALSHRLSAGVSVEF